MYSEFKAKINHQQWWHNTQIQRISENFASTSKFELFYEFKIFTVERGENGGL
jgi:hypothetical protein